MAAPRVSVILPCWNAAPYLPRALQSLSAQTFSDFEIIAVDDGSTDQTPQILREWASREARIRQGAPGRFVVARPTTAPDAHAS